MILKNKKISLRYWVFILFISLVIPVYSKAGNWLWKVDKKEYTVDEFSIDYKTYLQLMALQMETSTGVLQKYIESADNNSDPRTKVMIDQLRPNHFAENFIGVMLLNRHAVENKYFERPETIQIEKYLRNYTIAQLYLNDIISKINIEIKDEDAEKQWVSEREKNENLKTVPIQEGIGYMKQRMIQEKRIYLKQEFVKSLFERYKVEKNTDYQKIINEFKIIF